MKWMRIFFDRAALELRRSSSVRSYLKRTIMFYFGIGTRCSFIAMATAE